MEEKQIEKILKEALKYYHTDALPLEKLEEYLMEKHGFTKEQAENFWFKALKSRIAEIAIDVTNHYKPYNVIMLKNEEKYEIIG